MSSQRVTFLNRARKVVAVAQVMENTGRFAGSVDLSAMPAEMEQKFEEYEQIVEGQIFSLLDELEEQIASFDLKIVWAEGHEGVVEDLQIYPSTKRISFRAPKPAVDGQSALSLRPQVDPSLGKTASSERA